MQWTCLRRGGDESGDASAKEGGSTVLSDATTASTSTPGAASGTWVVGLDGSDCAANALEWAAANADGRATDVELVTAWQTPVVGAYPMSASMSVGIDDTELRDAAAHDVAQVTDDLGGRLDVPVTASVGHGGPAQVLLEASASAGLLVIGSRGRGGFARLLLGSTSTQCATHASVPTIVVPGDAEPKRAETILVGCDGSPNSMVALRWAIEFASPGGTVVVAWVWDATPLAVGADAFFFPDASDLAAERFHHLVDTVADQARARRGDVGTRVHPRHASLCACFPGRARRPRGGGRSRSRSRRRSTSRLGVDVAAPPRAPPDCRRAVARVTLHSASRVGHRERQWPDDPCLPARRPRSREAGYRRGPRSRD